MKLLEKLFNWMVVIGLVLLAGRVLTAVLMFLDVQFITFFKDHSIISLLILIVGAIGAQMIKDKKD